MDSNITQHFRKSEIPFLKYCTGLVKTVIDEYRPVLTFFLNPRQVYLLSVIANGYNEVHYDFFGGYSGAEMKRGIIFPPYYCPQISDFQLVLINVKYPVKFARLRHSQILGALMGTGIKRTVIGDILTDGRRWQFLTIKTMRDYLWFQIDRIGKVRVKLQPIALDRIVTPLNDWRDRYVVVSSLRIDNIIAVGFNVSRKIAKSLVKHGRVRLNWVEFDRPDFLLDNHDILSVRQYGRIRIKSLQGRSKKGKLKVIISIIKK